MTYLKKPSLSQQQRELQELIDKRLENEESRVRQRVYQWLKNNQYFVDNELFDFYLCVAQNIAAVEVLGGSGEKIIKAKKELEESLETYTTQIVDTSNWINEQLQSQLQNIQKNQQNLDTKMIQVLEGLAREHKNLQTVSTGLVNSVSVLLKKQQQLLLTTEAANKSVFASVLITWMILVLVLLDLAGVIFLFQ